MAKEFEETKSKAFDQPPVLPSPLALECSNSLSMTGNTIGMGQDTNLACQKHLPKISIDGESEDKDRLGLSYLDRSMIEIGAEFALDNSGVSKFRDGLVQDINAGDASHDAAVRDKLGKYLEDNGPAAFGRLVDELKKETSADYNFLNNISVTKDEAGNVTQVESNHFSIDYANAELDKYIYFSPEDKALADQAQRVKDSRFTEAADLNAEEEGFLKSALEDLNKGAEFSPEALKEKFQNYLDKHGAEAFSMVVRKLQAGVGSDSNIKNNIHIEGDVNGNIVKVSDNRDMPIFDARERDPAYAQERFFQAMHDDLHQGGIFKVESLQNGFRKYYEENGPKAFAEFVHRLKKELADDSEPRNGISVSSDGNGNISKIVSDQHSDKPIVLFTAEGKE